MMSIKNPIISRAFPFALYIIFLALDDTLKVLFSTLNIDDRWLYMIRVITTSSVIVYFWKTYIELTEPPKATHLIIGLLVGILVFVIWIQPFPSWAMLGQDVTAFNPYQEDSTQTAVFWLSTRILGAALVVPVMEELFWRSFILRWLDNKDFLSLSPQKVSAFAIMSSSALFAMEHHLWLAGLIAGLLYALLYLKFKNLWVPIFAHAVTNGILGIWVVQTNQWQYW